MITPPDENFKHYLTQPSNHFLRFNTVTENEVMNIINRLKSKLSFGHDKISIILIKKFKDLICKPLTIIINQSLTTGIFPSKLKLAKISPIFKNDDATLLTNYRPISLLNSFSKIFEKVIFKQIHHHFKTNNLYYNSQLIMCSLYYVILCIHFNDRTLLVVVGFSFYYQRVLNTLQKNSTNLLQ